MARADQQPTEETTVEVVTQAGDEYKTQGQTRVATRHGYAFRPSNQDLPEITSAGVNVTKDQAEVILAESATVDGGVFLIQNEEG
jgi:hypothetical protein